jgi:hypothetical protein
MKIHFAIAISAAALAVAGCEKKSGTPPAPPASNGANTAATAVAPEAPAPTPSARPGGNPLAAPGNYGEALAGAQGLALRTVDIASVNSAIQQFNASEDRYPKDLNELLAEHYLVKIPATPPGTQLEYDPQQGTVRIVRK